VTKLLTSFLEHYRTNTGTHTGQMIFKLAIWLNKCINLQQGSQAVINVNEANDVIVKTVLYCAHQQLEPVIVGVFEASLFYMESQVNGKWSYRTLLACSQEFGRDGKTSALESQLLSVCWHKLCATTWGEPGQLEAMSEVLDLINRLLPQSQNVGQLVKADQFHLMVKRIAEVIGLNVGDNADHSKRQLDILRQVCWI
jgi:hypothetical protein